MSTPIRTVIAALCAIALAAVIAAPAQARGGGGAHGVVVAHQDADTFVVANRGGHLRAIDAATLPAVGSVVKVKARKGVARRVRVVGTATRARLKGTVTASTGDRFTITGKADDGARVEVLFAAPVTQPALGRRVQVTVAIEGTTLRVQRVKQEGRGSAEIEGIVTAYDAAARTLTVTPENATPVVLAVPVSIDDAAFVVGAKIELKVLLLADGTYVVQRVDDRGGDDDDRKGRGRGRDDD